jgi:HAMP domain-containing protein
MSIRTKFNLALVVLFAVSLAISGPVVYYRLQQNAREEVLQTAAIMMDAALSMRGYTVKQVRPLLEMQLRRKFLPQSVPAYAATEIFTTLRSAHPEYTYKEATLNPTNPRDRATDWETDIVQEFRNNTNDTEIIAGRDTPTGRVLYLAHPIRITNKACLECHSVPAAAPKTMLSLYGDNNGFGWKLNEIVGAQVVSVPMAIPIQKANVTFYTVTGAVTGIFILLAILLNVMLGLLVIRPLARISNLADQMSQGNMEVPELPETGKDEVSVLTRSFNRLRRSLEKAMTMIEE